LLEGNPEANWLRSDARDGRASREKRCVCLGLRAQAIVSLGGIDEAVSIAEFHHVLRTHALAAFDYLMAGA